MKLYIIFILAIVFNAGANIMIKVAMKKSPISLEQGSVAKGLIHAAQNPWLDLGILLFGLALAAYSAVLSKINLSTAYPIMTGAGFLIVFLVSALYLGEKLTTQHIAGAILVLMGLWLLAGKT